MNFVHPPHHFTPSPPSAASIDPSIYQLPAANYMVEKIFTKRKGGSSGFCQRRSDLNLDAQYFELVMYVCLWAKMFVPKDCTSVTHALSGPLSHLTKTTHKFNAPNFNWFNFAGKVVIFSRRCHPRSRPMCALREPKIARSKSFLLLLLLPS